MYKTAQKTVYNYGRYSHERARLLNYKSIEATFVEVGMHAIGRGVLKKYYFYLSYIIRDKYFTCNYTELKAPGRYLSVNQKDYCCELFP